jgi:hypothetical protein
LIGDGQLAEHLRKSGQGYGDGAESGSGVPKPSRKL